MTGERERMFTGIITDIGRVRSAQTTGMGAGEGRHFEIATAFETKTIAIGASISCAGACMTVVDKGTDWFAVDVSSESLSKTTLGCWRKDTPINLERALCLGDELGGHLVSGHVDGVGTVVNRQADGDSQRLTVRVDDDLAPYIAAKGSVTLDGVSLTVNEVSKAEFGVNVIPHTIGATTLGTLAGGDHVNVEIDLLARYVARLLAKE